MTKNDEKQNNHLNSNFTNEVREMRIEIQPTEIKNEQETNARKRKQTKRKIKKQKQN